MTGASTRVWVLLGGISGIDFVWCGALGIGIAHWWPLAVLVAALLGVAFGYRRADAGFRVAAAAEWVLLWVIFSVAGALLTYLAAAQGGALYDRQVAEADAALGFDWSAWYRLVAGHPLLRLPLTVAYHSLVPQILLSVLWFSYRGWEHRNAELLTNVTVALLFTVAVFSLFPTLGPCVGLPEFRAAYVEDLVALRNGALPSLDIMLLKGVIAFPSFHAVLATLFTYAHRRSPTLLPVAAFNALMLVSLPSEGGHYLSDVLGGMAVGTFALVATRVMPLRLPALAEAGTA